MAVCSYSYKFLYPSGKLKPYPLAIGLYGLPHLSNFGSPDCRDASKMGIFLLHS